MTRCAMIVLWSWSACVAAAEPCDDGDAELVDALRADDAPRAAELLQQLGQRRCEPLSASSPPVRSDVVTALRVALPVRPVLARWAPRVSLTGTLSPGWRANSRLDAGRAVVRGVDWSVALGLTFAPRVVLPPDGVELSRADARGVAADAEQRRSEGGAVSLAWRVEALARWLGEQAGAALADAEARERSVAPGDLRGRVLRALGRQEDLARAAAWLGVGTRR